jgi:hypothetical protein
MIKRIKLLVVALAVLVSGVGTLAAPALVQAASPKNTVCTTLGSDASCNKKPDGDVDINSVITTAIKLMTAIVGIFSVIMIIFAGFKYVTSGGDANKTASAKNTIIYAIVGLVIVALAQAIVKFVLNKV